MKRVRIHSVFAALLAFTLGSPASATKSNEEAFVLSFVVGDYVIVGKAPDNGATYAGVARIERQSGRLLLHRRIGSKDAIAEGAIETPSPPGEGEVLRFRWHDDEPRLMTCLVDSDLDNYARLTCFWAIKDHDHVEPGLETMFPTAAWPDDAPNKSFQPPATNRAVR